MKRFPWLAFVLAACLGGCAADGRDEDLPGLTSAQASAGDDAGGADATSGRADSSSSEGDESGSGGEDDESSTGGAPPDDGPSFGFGSAFDDVMQMFDYVNEQRQGYLSHARWRGPPWTGSQHESVTWPTTFAWDDALAAEAQALANGLAMGSPPPGSAATDGLTPPIYLDGVDSAHYTVSGRENPDSWGVENQSSLSKEHGSARMGVFYHDPGGQGPVLTRLGIGAADAGAGATWWVLIFS